MQKLLRLPNNFSLHGISMRYRASLIFGVFFRHSGRDKERLQRIPSWRASAEALGKRAGLTAADLELSP